MLSVIVFGISTGVSLTGYKGCRRNLNFVNSASNLRDNFQDCDMKNAYLMTQLKCLQPVQYNNSDYLIKVFSNTPVYKSITVHNGNAWEERRNGYTDKTVEKAGNITALDDDKIILNFMPTYLKRYRTLIHETSEFNHNQEENINVNFDLGHLNVRTKNEVLEKVIMRIYGVPVDSTYYLILGNARKDNENVKTFMENENLMVIKNQTLVDYKNELSNDMMFYRCAAGLSVLAGIVSGIYELKCMWK